MEYGKNKKRFVFYMTDDVHARFLVRLTEDGIKKTSLIRDFIEAYIADDPKLREWLMTDLSSKKSAKWMAKRKRELKKEALQNTSFNLDGQDVSEIFDILADEDKYE
jgi:LPS O-antigen subunit length determinant protein (WzzB/FepE family)